MQAAGIRHTAWRLSLTLAAALAWLPVAAGAATVHHDLHVVVAPEAGRMTVTDTISLPEGVVPRFSLHAALSPQLARGTGLRRLDDGQGAAPLRHYAVEIPDDRRLVLHYTGPIAQLPAAGGSPGLIADQGIYLDPMARWYPDFSAPVSFTLRVEGPADWRAISQGSAIADAETAALIGAWREHRPQPGIWLIANAFTDYTRSTPWAEAQAYLRAPDAALAERYLSATAAYLDHYSKLLGPYPYTKFALVENTWESGWGMPSFTLLGPRVIRLPFILHTSYPHEILHNWWGNGVYVDPAGGNWAEGLTTYLADHERAARNGTAAEHRRAALQAYAAYVREAQEFPLSGFAANHGAVSQAIGYSKGMMLFHMLRLRLGERAFLAGLRRLYREHLFMPASFGDLQAAFAAEGGSDLSGFFSQWVDRMGAPRLALENVRVAPVAGGFRLRGRLRQVQPEPVFRLQVPVAVQLEGEAKARERRISLLGRETEFDWRLPSAPRRFAVDPRFDLFRHLDEAEIPPSLAQAFGAPRNTFVLPAEAPAARGAAYRKLAESWARAGDRIVEDSAIDALPDAPAVWLLGWENRLRAKLERAVPKEVVLSTEGIRLGGTFQPRSARSVALAARRPAGDGRALVWIGADDPAALPGLTRKLPHYGKYSYVVFTGHEPDKILAGQWSSGPSPLNLDLAGDSPPLTLPARAPLGVESDGTQR